MKDDDPPHASTSETAAPMGLGLTGRERLIAAGIFAIAGLLVIALIAAFWQPGPPSRVIMSTGAEDGAYHAFAQRYRAALARAGVELVLQPSAGAVQNLERLRDPASGMSVALVQGGLADPEAIGGLVSLGAVAYEPVWVFHRAGIRLERFGDLARLRVAAGAPGSGTRLLAEQFYQRHGIDPAGTSLLPLSGLKAADALERGEVDAAFIVSAPEGAAVRRLLAAEGVDLWSMRHADAYVRQFPVLTRIEIPEGAADLRSNLPRRSATLVSVKANLVAREQLHPVLVDLLLDAAREVHSGGGVIQRPGEFPSLDASEYPASAEAERYYKRGPSALRRYLPFWAVVWIERFIFFGLPLLAVGIPLARLTPAVYRWAIRRRIYRWYDQLVLVERAVAAGHGSRDALLARLAQIEARINRQRIPPAYGSEAYTLRTHIELVRRRLEDR